MGLEHFKRARFEQPVVQPESTVGEMQQLHPVAATVDENEQAAVGRVRLKLFANDPRQTLASFPHVGVARMHEDSRVARESST